MRVVLDLHSPFGGIPTVSGYVDELVHGTEGRSISLLRADGPSLSRQPGDLGTTLPMNLCKQRRRKAAKRAARAAPCRPRAARDHRSSSCGGGPQAPEMEPPVPGVVYSVHSACRYHDQGVQDPAGIAHPGMIGQTLGPGRAAPRVEPVRDWQRDYGVQIYIGEFSAIRWAPDDSAYRYLKDCIALFVVRMVELPRLP